MNDKLAIIEFDEAEAESIIEMFQDANLENFFPALIGEECAHEAMDAMRNLVGEIHDSIATEDIDGESFYCVSVELTNSQLAALLRYSQKITIEDVSSLGHSKKLSKEIINALWCIKEGLMRAWRNLDQPLR